MMVAQCFRISLMVMNGLWKAKTGQQWGMATMGDGNDENAWETPRLGESCAHKCTSCWPRLRQAKASPWFVASREPSFNFGPASCCSFVQRVWRDRSLPSQVKSFRSRWNPSSTEPAAAHVCNKTLMVGICRLWTSRISKARAAYSPLVVHQPFCPILCYQF